ncbi:hypothetical protein [Streptomyces sp. MnatMP-M17]|uniref:hypothetical protein n=1 Tax=unclassified Streptomyces TaxID=2593676 RepID=UPI0021092119|nr:hypothetical protein [Streptomyces sp. MnatMP-M17]
MTRLAFLLADLPIELLGRMRSDRVLYFQPPPQPAGAGASPSAGPSSRSRLRPLNQSCPSPR